MKKAKKVKPMKGWAVWGQLTEKYAMGGIDAFNIGSKCVVLRTRKQARESAGRLGVYKVRVVRVEIREV
ncbi:MAG: hypothetical protein ACYSWU_00915 [Planctomycetota bacterium]|jgi:hypothetical protein